MPACSSLSAALFWNLFVLSSHPKEKRVLRVGHGDPPRSVTFGPF
jgi:hypothetical protein